MKHIFLLLSIMLILGCSQGITKPIEHSLVIKTDKEIISDLDFIENKLSNYINKSKSSTISIGEVFENSWLSSIKTNYALDQSVSIEITEHHPIASLGQNKYITQKGTLIHPKGQFKELKLQESQVGFREAQSGPFFRKGKKNQWKNILNVQQINILENKFRNFMDKFDYD